MSKEIHEGKRQVPESDDNETIKKFNIRMYSTYDTKGKSSYEEAKRPTGYYNEKGEFVKDPYPTENQGNRNHKNPRWHPIPLKEENVVIPPHTTDDPTIIPPVKPLHTDDEKIIPPVALRDLGKKENIIPPNPQKSASSSKNIKQKPTKDKNKKRRIFPWLAIPLVASATLLIGDKNKSQQQNTTSSDGNDQNPTELVVQQKVLTPSESDYLRYTIEKGQRMFAKQFNVSVDEGAQIYNQFVENISQGNIPEFIQDQIESHNMSKMVHKELGIDLDRPEIVATTIAVLGESYPAIHNIIDQTINRPEEEINQTNQVRLKKYISMAKNAAQKHEAEDNTNQLVTIDYGLYGASKKTGWAIQFRDTKQDKADYQSIAKKALNSGQEY